MTSYLTAQTDRLCCLYISEQRLAFYPPIRLIVDHIQSANLRALNCRMKDTYIHASAFQNLFEDLFKLFCWRCSPSVFV